MGPINCIIIETADKNKKSSTLALQILFYTVFADIWVVILGKTLDLDDADNHPRKFGQQLTYYVSFFYAIAIFFFILTGINYTKFIKAKMSE